MSSKATSTMEGLPVRKTHSPTRQRLSALSPLQAFSPLESESALPRSPSTRSSIGHSRSSSASSTYSSGPKTMLFRSLSGARDRDRVFRRDSHGASPGVTTRLILVKAPQENVPPLRQRSKSSSNLPANILSTNSESPISNAPPTSARSPRRSFASASFASFSPITTMSPISTALDDREREAGMPPRRMSTLSLAGGSAGVPPGPSKTLSPDEILNLAKGLMSPVLAPDYESDGSRPPALVRRKSTGGSVSSGPMASEPISEPIELEPVDYVQMDEDALLPFSDRPKQVEELLEKPVNAPMLSLLRNAFSKGPRRENWKSIDVTEWTWLEFLHHLTKTTRAECPDYEWVFLARTAVRSHSVALWEKLGACLGCDPELLMAGEEDETPASWGGLGLGEEGEYDPSLSRVHIAALEAGDPDDEYDEDEAGRALALEFGEPVEMGDSSLSTYAMETIGEREELSTGSGSSGSGIGSNAPAPVSPFSTSNPLFPMSPDPSSTPRGRTFSTGSQISIASSDSSSPASPRRKPRSRSSVGLQILTIQQPEYGNGKHALASPVAIPGLMSAPQFERTPGNPLFVSSFNTLSLGPNLSRKASTGYGSSGGGPSHDEIAFMRSGRPLTRKSSGGLSESAITFVTDVSGPF